MTKRGFISVLVLGLSWCMPLAALGQAPAQPVSPAPAQQTAGTPAASNHVIVKGDVVTITVVRHPEFSSDYLLTNDTPVDVMGVGAMKLVGMTVADATTAITDGLKKRLKKPEVYVNVKTSEKISVGGEVKTPALVDLKNGWHLTEYITASGGLNGSLQPGDVEAIITHTDGTSQKFSVTDTFQNRNGANPELKSGDIVVIIAVETIPVFISGEVNIQGMVQVRKDRAGILQALAVAGGVKPTAALTQIKIVRAGGKEVPVNLAPSLLRGEDTTNLPKLESGDIVLVPMVQAHYSVLGAVSTSGPVPIQDPSRPIRMADVIAAAKADPAHARLSQVQLVRVVDGKEQRSVYDIGRYFKTGNPKDNPEIKDGDMVYVPDTNQAKIQTYASGLSAAAILFRLLSR